jgi:hypothetical protein
VSRRPPGEELTEPPVGFSVNYYNKDGLRGYALDLTLHDRRSVEEIKDRLYLAYLTLCRGIQPRGPIADSPTVANLTDAKIRAGIKRAMAAERGDEPPEAA